MRCIIRDREPLAAAIGHAGEEPVHIVAARHEAVQRERSGLERLLSATSTSQITKMAGRDSEGNRSPQSCSTKNPRQAEKQDRSDHPNQEGDEATEECHLPS